jgi:hypothetical protein
MNDKDDGCILLLAPQKLGRNLDIQEKAVYIISDLCIARGSVRDELLIIKYLKKLLVFLQQML